MPQTPLMTYNELSVVGSPYDYCATALIILNCDGTVARRDPVVANIVPYDPNNPNDPAYLAQPVLYHSMRTNVSITRSPIILAAIEEADESGQANVNAAKYSVPAKNDGWNVTLQGSSRIDPVAMSILDYSAHVMDETRVLADGVNAIHGIEEAVSVDEACPTCNRTGATCTHQVAVLGIHNNVDGDGNAHPQYPYWANIHKSIVVEASAEDKTNGRGFNQISYSWKLQRNTMFRAPWGIETRSTGNAARWQELGISNEMIAASAELQGLLDSCSNEIPVLV